jgi:hypothetical protein
MRLTPPRHLPIPTCTHVGCCLLSNSHPSHEVAPYSPIPHRSPLTSLALFKTGSHYCKAPARARFPPAHRIAPPPHVPWIGLCPTLQHAPHVRHHPIRKTAQAGLCLSPFPCIPICFLHLQTPSWAHEATPCTPAGHRHISLRTPLHNPIHMP